MQLELEKIPEREGVAAHEELFIERARARPATQMKFDKPKTMPVI